MGEDLHTLIVGIDEAGRGPVLGDMIIGFAISYKYSLRHIRSIGVADSKSMTREERERVFYLLKKTLLGLLTIAVPPILIDRRNINRLTAEMIVNGLSVISEIFHRTIPSRIEIYIDEIKGVRQLIETGLSSIFPGSSIRVIMEKGADGKYAIVSAASIIAKHYRDSGLEPIGFIYGDPGSGYSSDPRTREWLKLVSARLMEPPLVIRRTWGTLKSINPKWHVEKHGSHSKSILDYL